MRRFAPVPALFAVSACASAPPPPAAAPSPSVPAIVAAPVPAPPRDVVEAKDRVLALVNAGDAKGLFGLFDDGMQKAVPLDKVSAILTDCAALLTAGSLTKQ